jgi:response regulator RpfG family c-di-GMP phosphodiesterase
LTSIWYRIVSFINFVEALYYFNKNFTDCILVITDYSIPQISGDLIKKIKDLKYRIKILVIGATINNNIIDCNNDELSELKANKILEKPVYLDRLKKVVQELLPLIFNKKYDSKKILLFNLKYQFISYY